MRGYVGAHECFSVYVRQSRVMDTCATVCAANFLNLSLFSIAVSSWFAACTIFHLRQTACQNGDKYSKMMYCSADQNADTCNDIAYSFLAGARNAWNSSWMKISNSSFKLFTLDSERRIWLQIDRFDGRLQARFIRVWQNAKQAYDTPELARTSSKHTNPEYCEASSSHAWSFLIVLTGVSKLNTYKYSIQPNGLNKRLGSFTCENRFSTYKSNIP